MSNISKNTEMLLKRNLASQSKKFEHLKTPPKILTADDINEEVSKREVARRSQYSDELDKFLKTDIVGYEKDSVREGMVLLRVFAFEPNSEARRLKNVVDAFDKNNMKNQHVEIDTEVMNVAKVIKSNSKEFKEGDVVILPYNEIVGVSKNPDWELFDHSSKIKGATAIPPEDSRKMIPKIEKNWARYMYVKLGSIYPTSEDRLTYCVPDANLQSRQ